MHTEIVGRTQSGWPGDWRGGQEWVGAVQGQNAQPAAARMLDNPGGSGQQHHQVVGHASSKVKFPHSGHLRHPSHPQQYESAVRLWGNLSSVQRFKPKSTAHPVHLQDSFGSGLVQVAARPGPAEAGRSHWGTKAGSSQRPSFNSTEADPFCWTTRTGSELHPEGEKINTCRWLELKSGSWLAAQVPARDNHDLSETRQHPEVPLKAMILAELTVP